LRDIVDAKLLLDLELTATVSLRSRLGMAGWVAAGVVALIAAALAFIHFREKAPEAPIARFTILPPEKTSFRFDVEPNGVPALSPDGRRLVFGARSEDGSSRLWIRSLDATTAQPLTGTEGAGSSYPFWSPDGRAIAFGADGRLKRIELSGGPAVTLAAASVFRGGSWSPRGVILLAPNSDGPIRQITAAGGTATPVTVLDPARKETSHRWPWFLPDGRHFLYAAFSTNTNDATVYVGSLDSRETRIVAQANSNAAYASDHLLFLRDNTLMAQPFDAERLTTTGEAAPIAEQIAGDPSSARSFFAVSANGTLVFQSGVQARQALAWLDRAGKRLATVGEPGQLTGLSLSPEGKRAAVSVFDQTTRVYDLWIYDLARNRRSRLTFDPVSEFGGVWSPDGNHIVFSSNRQGHFDLYRKHASGAGAVELLYADSTNKYSTSWSPDGKFVIYVAQNPKTRWDLSVLPLERGRKPFPFLKTDSIEVYGQFSPDGRWVAYRSDESGRFEIYVAPFSNSGGKRQVSFAGGAFPRWRADGKELFYVRFDGRLIAAEVGLKGAEVEIGAVRPLFGSLPATNSYLYDVSADGQRFLAIMPNEQAAPEPLTLVQNWTAGLKK
jgi:eukaryotic-like serine/threonine-protein kinase